MKKYIELAVLLVFIFSIPLIIKKCDFKNGSAIVSARIVGVKRCGKLDNCFSYHYYYEGHEYMGEAQTYKGPTIGSEILVEISIKDPSISYIKK